MRINAQLTPNRTKMSRPFSSCDLRSSQYTLSTVSWDHFQSFASIELAGFYLQCCFKKLIDLLPPWSDEKYPEFRLSLTSFKALSDNSLYQKIHLFDYLGIYYGMVLLQASRCNKVPLRQYTFAVGLR